MESRQNLFFVRPQIAPPFVSPSRSSSRSHNTQNHGDQNPTPSHRLILASALNITFGLPLASSAAADPSTTPCERTAFKSRTTQCKLAHGYCCQPS
jgi:hypothetical protein